MSIQFSGLEIVNGVVQKITLSPFTNTSPEDGDIWFDGTSINFRESGSTGAIGELGEVNTYSSAGGDQSIITTKSGSALQFKGLTAGTGITLTPSATDITIAASGGGGGGGETNTASSAGGTESLVLTKVGVDLPFKGLSSGTNLSVAEGTDAITLSGANFDTAVDTVKIGSGAGASRTSTEEGVYLGKDAGKNGSGLRTTCLGYEAGALNNNGDYATAIGYRAGYDNQGMHATAMGTRAGYLNQGASTVAIGYEAGYTGQGLYGVAIGYEAGRNNQGNYSVCIGFRAGYTTCHNNCVIINASGSDLSSDGTDRFFLAPVTSGTGSYNLEYDTTTKEIKYNTGKNFIIDHPIDDSKYLVHCCMEGPQADVMYTGTGNIVEGECIILLPDYCTSWTDFSVTVTPLGSPNPGLYATEVRNNLFTVFGIDGKFSWTVYAKRCDIEVEPLKKDNILKGDGPYKYLEKPGYYCNIQ